MRSSQPSSFTHDSSIDSHVRIVPPSNSSSSPRSTMVTSRIYSGVPAPPPPVPPVPNQPAPLPPSPNRRFPRAGNNTIERSAFNPPLIPPNRFMSPIQELDRFSDINLSERRTPSPVHSFASSNRAEQISRPGPAAVNGRKLSSENPRPLPAPSNASGPSPPDYLNTHQRSASDSISRSASSGSVYEDDFQNGTGGPGHARSRSASADSQAPPPRHGLRRRMDEGWRWMTRRAFI
ncbi:hypothetical protein BDZ97DRAFT_551618 [Flammula alnicola]|nr:hypothetical protein BDZ97DRAFT_551618 [Flammula alnicola]